MENVAAALNRKWSGERARVHYIREYDFEDQWSYNYLKSLGITQIDRTPPPGQPQDRPADWRNGIHDDIYYEAQIAVQDPKLIRMDQRLKVGLFSLHGVDLAPIGTTIEIDRNSPSTARESQRRPFRHPRGGYVETEPTGQPNIRLHPTPPASLNAPQPARVSRIVRPTKCNGGHHAPKRASSRLHAGSSPGRLLLRAYCCMEPFIKGTDQTTCGTDVVAERSTGAASRLPRVGVP